MDEAESRYRVTCRGIKGMVQLVKKLFLMILILAVAPAAIVVCIGLLYGLLHNVTTAAH